MMPSRPKRENPKIWAPAGRFYSMVEVQLQISESIKTDSLVQVVERVCGDNGLTCTLKGTLVSYPGSIHWHFKKEMQKGTLEITWWESKHRLWFKVAENRIGTWIEAIIPILKKQIETSKDLQDL
jgi:hypothetical protein